MDENKKEIDEFFVKGYEEIVFDNIIGYNPMGAIRYGNLLLIKYLMIIEKNGVEENINGNFCLGFDDHRDWIVLYKQL
jgi:hypothetical protein